VLFDLEKGKTINWYPGTVFPSENFATPIAFDGHQIFKISSPEKRIPEFFSFGKKVAGSFLP
jgi:hypothetical protein